ELPNGFLSRLRFDSDFKRAADLRTKAMRTHRLDQSRDLLGDFPPMEFPNRTLKTSNPKPHYHGLRTVPYQPEAQARPASGHGLACASGWCVTHCHGYLLSVRNSG